MKVKYTIFSIICLIAIGFVTLAIAEQGTLNQNMTDKVQNSPKKIEVIDPAVAKPLISKEHALAIASKFLIPLDNRTKISLLRDDTIQKPVWEFAYLNDLEEISITIDADTGQLIAYFNFSRMSSGVPINSDDAPLKAKSHFKQFDVDINTLDVSHPSIKTVEISNGKTYNIFWKQQKNGITVYKNFVAVGLNADTGNLISFTKQLSDVSNVNTIPKLTQDEAVRIAKDFLARNYNMPADSKLLGSSLEIRKPNDWAINREVTLKGDFTLTWVVEFQDKTRSDDAIVNIWLDAVTGEVIGGETCK
ncbi:hypothetical protein METP2_01864 [Methanosarcinales archaeon]|nr:PepSY domain-containing protein [Candidatus Methanoperedens sp.]CAG0979223.1 hypothetical protein METP2_01864 [Methanosarcinales archaeon]